MIPFQGPKLMITQLWTDSGTKSHFLQSYVITVQTSEAQIHNVINLQTIVIQVEEYYFLIREFEQK